MRMDRINITYHDKPELKDPIFIEGLPGVGNVGKIAADHLKDELKAKKFATVHSRHFPPQVLVGDDGMIRLVNNEMYYHKGSNSDKGKGKNDIIFLVGDYQGLSPEGQYELADAMLDLAVQMKVRRIFTLGGYGLGRMVEKPRVLGATTNPQLKKEMAGHGVVFAEGEPGAGIVGASGLLLGLGEMRGIEGVCLMGETSGYFVDPNSAREVLRVLVKALGVEVGYGALEAKAEQVEKLTSRFKDLEKGIQDGGKQEDLNYIG